MIATPGQETRIAATLAALAAVERACAASLDPAIVALCRNRISLLLGAESVPDPNVAVPSPAERACLSFAEQFVLGVASIDDAAVAALLEHLTASETYVFVRWLQASEASQRVVLLLRHDDRLRAMCATAFGAEVTSR